jgi:hypothetical protein
LRGKLAQLPIARSASVGYSSSLPDRNVAVIISECLSVPNFSPEASWASLQRFQNTAYVAERIAALHNLKPNHAQNAKKQARQLRYCLMQAREYYRASAAVSLATRPNLLYYSIMSLALAEILLKSTGDNSLDRAREQHRHHGLTFEHIASSRTGPLDLSHAASLLKAKPLILGDAKRAGTFELWHQTCRELPLVGKVSEQDTTGATIERVSVVASGGDERLPLFPQAGMTLLQCMQNIPGMRDHLQGQNVPSNLLRARVSSRVSQLSEENVFSVVVHPSDLASQFFDNVELHPSLHDRVSFRELTRGGAFEFRTPFSQMDGDRFRPRSFSIPPGATWDDAETRFWYLHQPLNEFGFIYVALFIVGNYARYYPDRWLLDVENSSSLALAVEELLGVADARMAWLTLGELDRKVYAARA